GRGGGGRRACRAGVLLWSGRLRCQGGAGRSPPGHAFIAASATDSRSWPVAPSSAARTRPTARYVTWLPRNPSPHRPAAPRAGAERDALSVHATAAVWSSRRQEPSTIEAEHGSMRTVSSETVDEVARLERSMEELRHS